MFATINDAFAHFEDLHGGERPVRSRDELRSAIHAVGLRYEQIDDRFWDAAFDSGWAHGETDDLDAVIRHYRPTSA